MSETQLTYRFKWSNLGLDDYLKGMRFRADELRRRASTLMAQAEMIDEERVKLESDLLPVAAAE